jgi:hypothetical protein
MEKVVYDQISWPNCIEPKNPLEEEVLRRSILPDALDELPGRLAELLPFQRRLLVTGGKFVADNHWCNNVLTHYQLCEKASSGWFALQVTFWHRDRDEGLGGFTLRAALSTFPPLIQAPWLGYKRNFHCHPIWRIPEDGDLRISGVVRLKPELPSRERVFLLSVSSHVYEYFEWNRVAPHKFLIDPSSFGSKDPTE